MKKYRLLTILALVCFMLVVAGCDTPTGVIPQIGTNNNGGTDGGKDDKKDDGKTVFKVYRADKNLEWLIAEEYTLENIKEEDKLKELLKVLVSEQPKSNDVQNIFPAKTKILDVKVTDGLAEVNFSKELLENHIGGSSYELLLVGSIVDTLTEFPEVKKVQILVDGERIETINGHMDLVDPLKRNEDLIKQTKKN